MTQVPEREHEHEHERAEFTNLIDYARAQGVAYYQGTVATGNTIESARLRAIIPAIKAIEAKKITFTSDLPGAITRAYAEGARITYNTAESLKSAVSKTAQFLIAADKGLAMSALQFVDTVIHDTKDSGVQAAMRKRAFEKLTDVCRIAIDVGGLPYREEVIEILNPQKADPSKDAQLVKLFTKLEKLAKAVGALDIDRYSAMAVEGLRYERLADEHKALAERASLTGEEEREAAALAKRDARFARRRLASKAVAALNTKETALAEQNKAQSILAGSGEGGYDENGFDICGFNAAGFNAAGLSRLDVPGESAAELAVTLQSNVAVETTEQDDVDRILKLDA